ncbi:hypothetical protein C2E23DRAFT_820887, partial [Lenzites betulinus]
MHAYALTVFILVRASLLFPVSTSHCADGEPCSRSTAIVRPPSSDGSISQLTANNRSITPSRCRVCTRLLVVMCLCVQIASELVHRHNLTRTLMCLSCAL